MLRDEGEGYGRKLAAAGVRNQVPEIQTREMESVLQVGSGQTVILGGLMQNEVQRAVLLCEGDEVDATDLSITNVRREIDGGPDTNFTLLEGVERNAIVQMLKETGGNKLETAKRLGIGRQTLYNKIKAYGIEV